MLQDGSTESVDCSTSKEEDDEELDEDQGEGAEDEPELLLDEEGTPVVDHDNTQQNTQLESQTTASKPKQDQPPCPNPDDAETQLWTPASAHALEAAAPHLLVSDDERDTMANKDSQLAHDIVLDGATSCHCPARTASRCSNVRQFRTWSSRSKRRQFVANWLPLRQIVQTY